MDRRTEGRTERHSSNVCQMFDRMSTRNLGSQIIIFRCYTRIDKTNIPYEEDIKVIFHMITKNRPFPRKVNIKGNISEKRFPLGVNWVLMEI